IHLHRYFGTLVATTIILSPYCARGDETPRIGVSSSDGKVKISIADRPVATYVYDDPAITRPYFAHIRTSEGTQVNRNHPPIEGKDLMDHPTFHPGIWMAFGDISGSDNWRLKARVRHAGFAEEPRSEAGKAVFAVRNEYLDQ